MYQVSQVVCLQSPDHLEQEYQVSLNLDSNPQPQEEEKKEEPPQEEQLSPQQKLDKFLEEHPGPFVNLCKMLKMSIPEPAVRQKAQMTGLDMDLVDEMVTLYNEAHPY